MNFLHYAIFMFVVCSIVLVAVSHMTPAPDRKRLAGLTFATVDDKIETIAVGGPPMRKPAHETPTEHAINVVFSLLLLGTVVGLWIYFR
jgi:SSS family solute:Na+ symporter